MAPVLARRNVYLASVLGLVISSGYLRLWSWSFTGPRDFTAFYVGAQLLDRDPYSLPANLDLQRKLTGTAEPALLVIRPPFWLAAMKPLSLLPYRYAFGLWLALSACAVVAFALWFPSAARPHTVLALCWSWPLLLSFRYGQDTPFLMLWICLSILAWRKGHPALAGALLGLCLPKFHLLAFLPLLFWQRRYWRVLAGFAAVAGLAILLSFAVLPDWMTSYRAALANPALQGGFVPIGHQRAILFSAAVLAGLLLWRICRVEAFEFAMPLCVLGAISVSWHVGIPDLVLAIPGLLSTLACRPAGRYPLAALLSPIPLLCADFARDYSPFGMLFMAVLAWLAFSRTTAISGRVLPPLMAAPSSPAQTS
jgi:hypothetical protein